MRSTLLCTALLACLLSGCVKESLPEYKPATHSTAGPSPTPARSSDPGMEGNTGQAAFSLMDRSGYLQCPVALRAVEEAQISPDFRQQIVHYFTNYQAKLRPLIDQARKTPNDIDHLIASAKDV